MNCRFFKGTKTLKFISNKNSGAVCRDFSLERSYESFCTDESMQNFDAEVTTISRKPREPVKKKPSTYGQSFM